MDAVRSTYGILSQFGGAPVPSSGFARPKKSSDMEFPDPALFDRNGDDRLDALDVVYTSSAKLQKFSEATRHVSTEAKASLPEPSSVVKRPLPEAYSGVKEAEEAPEAASPEGIKPTVSVTA